MKRTLITRDFFYFSLFSFFSILLRSQSSTAIPVRYATPEGVMDTVFDRFGKKYSVHDLTFRRDGESQSENTLVSSAASCTAGMFALYFAKGSGMEDMINPVHATRRQTLCEVVSNISGLLGYNSSYPNSALVRILVDDVSNHIAPVSPATSGVLGLASGFYVVPLNAANSAPGLVENLVQKTIKSQVNAWQHIISPVGPLYGSGFYHGLMAFNFSNPGIAWNSDISATAANNQFDLYSVVLHEITHILGFASLVGGNGISKFGPANNYYSLYDKYLCYVGANNVLTPLLSTGICNAQYDCTFTVNPGILAPGCTSNYASDITNCSAAIKFNSVLIPNMPVYTPACFEGASSLSHFEDMCYPSNTPSNNNQYFVMCNASAPGNNNRFLKEEEKNVLCDLGYTVTNTYTSNAVSASTSYTGATCSSSPVWGLNDGLSSNGFLYTSTGGPVSIPISGTTGVIANDYQGNNPVTTISCVESVYNNGTAVISGTNIVFTPVSNAGGIFVVRYIPLSSNGVGGNVTYVFGFIYPAFCGSVTPCDMVQNGGFENNSGCGSIPTVGTSTLASCWLAGSLTPDIFVRGCTSGTISADLGTSTYTSSTVFDSYNGAPNNAVMGLGAVSDNGELNYSESVANYLGTPISNNQAYTLSFWAYQFVGTKCDPLVKGNPNQSFNTDSISVVLSFATHSVYAPASFSVFSFPYTPLSTIQSVTLANAFNVWRHYSITFTTTAVNGGNWLYVGADRKWTYTNIVNEIGAFSANGRLFYTLLDEISLRPANQAPQLKMPAQICFGQSLPDLAQYVNVSGGYFSGAGVTSSVVSINNATVTQYNFNAAQTLPKGIYTIKFTYTDNLLCTQTAVQQVTIGNVFSGLNLAYASTTNCVNSGTLSVFSPPPSYNFTWQPGNYSGNTYTVSAGINTNYTVYGSNSSTCGVSGSITVIPNQAYAQIQVSPEPACKGAYVQITATGNYTAIMWQPGSYTTSVISVIPPSQSTYSAFVTSSLGCQGVVSKLIQLSSIPNVNISAPVGSICSGQSTTLTASGALNYHWSDGGFTSVKVVKPLTNTSYTVTGTGTSSNNCANTSTVLVKVFIPTISLDRVNGICLGESIVLSASGGGNSYAWTPANAYAPTITVTPFATTIYEVKVSIQSSLSACMASNSVQIVVNPCTGIDDMLQSPLNFILYPNPNEGTFNIESEQEKEVEIKIFNDSGQLVRAYLLPGANERKVVVSDLPSGIYIVESPVNHTKLVIIR